MCMSNIKKTLVDYLASRMLGERLPIDFGSITKNHKIQGFHLQRIAQELIETDGNPPTTSMPLSPIRKMVVDIYKHVKTITTK